MNQRHRDYWLACLIVLTVWFIFSGVSYWLLLRMAVGDTSA